MARESGAGDRGGVMCDSSEMKGVVFGSEMQRGRGKQRRGCLSFFWCLVPDDNSALGIGGGI